ncbi:MAG: outer membrane protein OmpW [Proteobacteria bacterium]|nr:MAG: outer membrane protein OmpW [Pseudomonadota bacterium]
MKSIKRSVLSTSLALLLAGIAPGASAAAGDYLLRFGAANVSPNDGSRGVVPKDAVGVDSGSSVYFAGAYMVTDQVGVELLAALPFDHDVTLRGTGKIAEVSHLPPTLSVTYDFSPEAKVRPYVGVGINYTTFSDEKATAAITSIELDDSWGLAVQAGLDADINDKWFFNASLRYIDIETTAKTNLGNIDVDINPWVMSVGVGMRF